MDLILLLVGLDLFELQLKYISCLATSELSV